MSLARMAAYFGAFLLTLFVIIVLTEGQYGGGNAFLVAVAVVLLIVAGSSLYGRRSRYGDIAARKRPAQEAHNRAADLAAEARRSTAEAAKSGERHCPLDPAQGPAGHGASNGNGHASAARPAPPPRPN